MTADTALVRSRCLVRVPQGGDDAIVFHSLFGTSLVLSAEAEALLDAFAAPTCVAFVVASCRGDVGAVLERFIERRFLVDPACNEREEFARAMRPSPPETGAHLKGLVLLAAEQCNLACPYCIKDKLMGLRPERRQGRMTLETARHAVDAFAALAAQHGQRDVVIQFRGGESLLNMPVVVEATRRMRTHWTGGSVHASMVTNAMLATDEIARTLADLGITVEVSIDGPRAIHDLVRVNKRGLPSYDAVIAGLARLCRAGVEVTNINTTLTAETLPFIGRDFLVMLARLGMRQVNVEPDVLRPAMADPEALASHLLTLRKQGRALGVDVGGCWGRALLSIGAVRCGNELPVPQDYALLVVDAAGEVVRWEYNGQDELGPVVDLPNVLASAAFRAHVESRSPGRIPECRGYEVEGPCQGNASIALVYERANRTPRAVHASLRADSRDDARRSRRDGPQAAASQTPVDPPMCQGETTQTPRRKTKTCKCLSQLGPASSDLNRSRVTGGRFAL